MGVELTKPGTYPSAVLLGSLVEVKVKDHFSTALLTKTKLGFLCGGTLINRLLSLLLSNKNIFCFSLNFYFRWYVLTAAHCDEDTDIKITKVRFQCSGTKFFSKGTSRCFQNDILCMVQFMNKCASICYLALCVHKSGSRNCKKCAKVF